ncbi:MAG: YgjP-like metallopeptidase domain-containing protein, partial [Rhodospirillaceae bacterium]
MGADPAVLLDIDGRPVLVRLRRNARARRIVLRIAPDGDGVVVTLPRGVPEAEGVAWAGRQTGWIATRLDRVPDRMPFADGVVIPFEGADHVIRHAPGARRGVWREAGEIRVSGRPEHLPRRVADWLRKEARA